jgi:hypothetical protein
LLGGGSRIRRCIKTIDISFRRGKVQILRLIIEWSNDNSGLVSIAIFLITIVYGFSSGIFSSLRHKPRFKIEFINGPTFCCTIPRNPRPPISDVHLTAFALYLKITNVGSSASSIGAIHLGYRSKSSHLFRPWFWLKDEIVALSEFQVVIGDSTKVYPFLKQGNSSFNNAEPFLEPGRRINGVVYFEQPESWGTWQPAVSEASVKVKIRIWDSFGRSHTRTFRIPSVTRDEALKYNPRFGSTRLALNSSDSSMTSP